MSKDERNLAKKAAGKAARKKAVSVETPSDEPVFPPKRWDEVARKAGKDVEYEDRIVHPDGSETLK